MYAIVNIAGSQFKVAKDENFFVSKLDGEVGKNVEFKDVLLVSNEGKVSVGQPYLEGASVEAEILGFEKGKKTTVFKKKRRKGYQVTRGHRQEYTSIKIKSISAS